MKIIASPTSVSTAFAAFVLLGVTDPETAVAQQTEYQYQNLQVLPEDISRNDLGDAMLQNLLGLGLVRRQGEGCLFCHVGDMATPRSSWDWASDDKPMKRKAREMMEMVQAINERYLPRLEDRVAPDLRVTCETCHQGRTDPRPLEDVLGAAYEAGGVDSAITRYQELRERYFAADAYDFRPHVLTGMAMDLAGQGEFDDALAFAATNVRANPTEIEARQDWLLIGLWRVTVASGIDAAMEQYDTWRSLESPEVMDWTLLDAFGWTIYRQDLEEEAVVAFEKNHSLFSDVYQPNETMAFIRASTGDLEGAIRIHEAWLETNSGHLMSERQLVDLRSRLERDE